MKVMMAVVAVVSPLPDTMKLRVPAAPDITKVNVAVPVASVDAETDVATSPLNVPVVPVAIASESEIPDNAAPTPPPSVNRTDTVTVPPAATGPAVAEMSCTVVAACAVNVIGLFVMLFPVTVAVN